MARTNYTTGAKWESIVGYSRAVRIGNTIEVSGTVSLQDGKLVGPGDPYLQAKRALEIIMESIRELGGKKEDIIRTRIYVTDVKDWAEVGKAHGECFADIQPATSMIQISALITPEFLVEIEATAILENTN